MDRLGYVRYGAQGGDFGAFVAPELGRAAPERVVGVHVNAATYGFIPFGEVGEAELATFTDDERTRLARLNRFNTEGNGYFQIQATCPQTVAYGLHDSPAGQLAWIADKFKEWTFPSATLPEAAIDRDSILTNVALYWFTGTAGSSANLYYEGMHAGTWHEDRGITPTGVAVFAEDVAIRRYAEMSHNVTPLERVRPRGPLRRAGGTGSARRRHSRLLPHRPGKHDGRGIVNMPRPHTRIRWHRAIDPLGHQRRPTAPPAVGLGDRSLGAVPLTAGGLITRPYQMRYPGSTQEGSDDRATHDCGRTRGERRDTQPPGD